MRVELFLSYSVEAKDERTETFQIMGEMESIDPILNEIGPFFPITVAEGPDGLNYDMYIRPEHVRAFGVYEQ